MLAACVSGVLPAAHGGLHPTQASDAPVDASLLEFLGSVDSEDSDWHDYLADRAGVVDAKGEQAMPARSPAAARTASDPPGAASAAAHSADESPADASQTHTKSGADKARESSAGRHAAASKDHSSPAPDPGNGSERADTSAPSPPDHESKAAPSSSSQPASPGVNQT
jgi:hypothetical protein